MQETGYIYILTNPSFEEYVKIGYADNVEKRVKQLNKSEAVPFGFRIYATYRVSKRLKDKEAHKIIDVLNRDLRSRDFVDGKLREREFFKISPEEAYSIFEAMAEIHGCPECLRKYTATKEEEEEEKKAKDNRESERQRRARFDFSVMGIPQGAEVHFDEGEIHVTAIVHDSRRVEYKGEISFMTPLTRKLKALNHDIDPLPYWTYQGKSLKDIYNEVYPFTIQTDEM